MRKLSRRFLKEIHATAALEFAFVIPVMLLLVAGSVEFGRWFQAYNDVNRLAARYAAVYADCNDNPNNLPTSPNSCNTELGLYWPSAALANIAPQLTTANVSVRMFQVQYASDGTSTIVYSYPASATMTTTEASTASTAIYSSGTTQMGVLVTVQYPYVALFFPQWFQKMAVGGNLALSYTVAQRKT